MGGKRGVGDDGEQQKGGERLEGPRRAVEAFALLQGMELDTEKGGGIGKRRRCWRVGFRKEKGRFR